MRRHYSYTCGHLSRATEHFRRYNRVFHIWTVTWLVSIVQCHSVWFKSPNVFPGGATVEIESRDCPDMGDSTVRGNSKKTQCHQKLIITYTDSKNYFAAKSRSIQCHVNPRSTKACWGSIFDIVFSVSVKPVCPIKMGLLSGPGMTCAGRQQSRTFFVPFQNHRLLVQKNTRKNPPDNNHKQNKQAHIIEKWQNCTGKLSLLTGLIVGIQLLHQIIVKWSDELVESLKTISNVRMLTFISGLKKGDLFNLFVILHVRGGCLFFGQNWFFTRLATWPRIQGNESSFGK